MKVLYLPAVELADGLASLVGNDDPDITDFALARSMYHSLQMQACAGDTWFELPQEDDEGGRKID